MECREQKPKDPYIFHVVRAKQVPERIAKLDKRGGNGKCVKAKKVMDLKYKWSMHTRPRHHLPVPSQYRRGKPWVKGMRGCGLTVERMGSLVWGSCLNSFGEKYPVGMTSHPREVNMSWNH